MIVIGQPWLSHYVSFVEVVRLRNCEASVSERR